jgi:hypothetical protein
MGINPAKVDGGYVVVEPFAVKTRIVTFVLSLFLVVVSTFADGQPPASGPVSERFLDALSMIESGGNHRAKGRAGERSAFQIRPVAWQYTSGLRQRAGETVHPFSAAGRSEIARDYARSLLEDHSRRFADKHERTPTPGELYAMWNLGFDGYQRRGSLDRCPELTRDAAQRLTNLLNQFAADQTRG